MKTIFAEMLEQARGIEGVGAKYAGVALMVAAMEQKPPGTLPLADAEIAALIEMSEENWRKIRQKVFAHEWLIRADRWMNKGLTAYIESVETGQQKNSALRGGISFDASTAEFIGITETHKKKWKELGLTVDIGAELASAGVWLLDNPDKLAKTKAFGSFLRNWFQKSAARAHLTVLKDPVNESGPAFMRFWAAYHPRRQINFSRAASAWKSMQLDPSAEVVMEGLFRWLESKDWKQNDGEFVPSPDKWLMASRWLDLPIKFQIEGIKNRQGQVVSSHYGEVDRDYGQIGTI